MKYTLIFRSEHHEDYLVGEFGPPNTKKGLWRYYEPQSTYSLIEIRMSLCQYKQWWPLNAKRIGIKGYALKK